MEPEAFNRCMLGRLGYPANTGTRVKASDPLYRDLREWDDVR